MSPTESSFDPEYRLILLVNSELKMSYGKLAAQLVHAVIPILRRADEGAAFRRWQRQGSKVICLAATTTQMLECLHSTEFAFLRPVPVFDAGRTEIPPNSLTVIGFDLIDDQVRLFDRFRLL